MNKTKNKTTRPKFTWLVTFELRDGIDPTVLFIDREGAEAYIKDIMNDENASWNKEEIELNTIRLIKIAQYFEVIPDTYTLKEIKK